MTTWWCCLIAESIQEAYSIFKEYNPEPTFIVRWDYDPTFLDYTVEFYR
jgi:DNA mismatch repair ATPase MutL